MKALTTPRGWSDCGWSSLFPRLHRPDNTAPITDAMVRRYERNLLCRNVGRFALAQLAPFVTAEEPANQFDDHGAAFC